MPNMNPALEELRWKKIPLLNDGFVCLVDAMGEDSSVVQAAKISYGKDVRDESELNTDTTDFPTKPCNICGSTSNPQWKGECNKDCIPDYEVSWFDQEQTKKNRTLLRYLMRNRHTTPFEMCELKFLIRIPMDAWRQMIRHRTASVNEYSTRYTEAIDSQQTTLPGEWRLQSGSNKQGSSGLLEEWPDTVNENPADCTPGEYLSAREQDIHKTSNKLYTERLRFGVARELARKDLPLSTYTEAYWKIDLHNLFHFLGLRMDSHAQLEIRLYANAIGAIAEQLFPMCWEAFRDYRLEAMQLSRMDILAAHELKAVPSICLDADTVDVCLTIAGFTNKREKDECIAKMKRLRIL